MGTNKTPEGKKPAFVVVDAKATEFIGLTKDEVFAALIAQGIFAGPSGREVLDAAEPDTKTFEKVADVAFRMGRAMSARSIT